MLSNKWAQAGQEPSLKEMMADPIVAMVMARDNLQADDVWKVVEKAKERIEKNAA